MDACPPAHALADYLADALDPADAEATEVHVEGCRTCQRELARLADSGARVTARPERAAVTDAWRPSAGFLRQFRETPHGQPARPTVVSDKPPPATPDHAPLPVLPGYLVVGVLGRGGMGVVYEAIQTDLGRRVALKMLRSDAGDSTMLARFRHEAEAVARLRHPGIVQIHAIGEHHGKPYLTLEHVDGPTLAARIAAGPLPPAEAAGLMEAVSRAVHHAHEEGVVHRDIKPSNILLAGDRGTEVGARGKGSGARGDAGSGLAPRPSPLAPTPKVTDFGLARRVDVPDQLTQTGVTVGTPSYMAPEQARGQGPVAAAADIHALGAVLYECLTGRPPFLGATAVETVMALVGSDPVSPRQLNPAVPRDLETIALKCLEKEPRRRYATAAAVADDLRRFLAGEPIDARPTSVVGRSVKWTRRNPAVAGLAAALVLGLAAGAAVFAVLWLEARAAERAERVQRGVADRKVVETAQLADQLTDEVARGRRREYARHVALADQYLLAGEVAQAAQVLATCPEDLRGGEWDYLHQLARSRTWPAPPYLEWGRPSGRFAALHPTGETVAVIDFDAPTPPALAKGAAPPAAPKPARVRVCDTHTQRVVGEWDVSARGFRGLAFADAGRRVVVLAAQPLLTAWDVATGKLVHQIEGTGAELGQFVLTPNPFAPLPPHLMTVEANNLVRVWDVPAGREAFNLTPPNLRTVSSVALCRNGVRFALAGVQMGVAPQVAPNIVCVGLLAQQRVPAQIPGAYSRDAVVAFGPDSMTVFVTGADGIVRVRSLNLPQAEHVLRGENAVTGAVAVDATGRLVAARLTDGSVQVFRRTGPSWGDHVRGPKFKGGIGGGVPGFLPDGRLVSLGASGWGHSWDAPGPAAVVFGPDRAGGPITDAGTITDSSFHPDGRRVATAGRTRVRVWDVTTGETEWTTPDGVDRVRRVRFAPSGALSVYRLLAEPVVEVWAVGGAAPRWTAAVGGRALQAAAFTDDGLVTVNNDNLLRSWAADGTPTGEWAVPVGGPCEPTLGDGGRTLYCLVGAADAQGGHVVVYDVPGRREVRRFDVPGGRGRLGAGLVIGPRRIVLMTGAADAAWMQVYDTEEGRPLVAVPMARNASGLSASADGRRLLTRDSSGLRLWDAETGYPLLELRTGVGPIRASTMSRDGRVFLAHGALDSTFVWGGPRDR